MPRLLRAPRTKGEATARIIDHGGRKPNTATGLTPDFPPRQHLPRALEERFPTIRVLQRLGFRRPGKGPEPDTLRSVVVAGERP